MLHTSTARDEERDDLRRKPFEERLEGSRSIDLSRVIERYRLSSGLSPEDAALHAREFVRYVLISAHDDCDYPMAGLSDEFWHVFLQFTRLYREFCTRVCGEFVDHEPLEGNVTDAEIRLYVKFRGRYAELFAEEPCRTVWPVLDPLEFSVRTPGFKFVGLAQTSIRR